MTDTNGRKAEVQGISFLGPDLDFLTAKAQSEGTSVSAIVRRYIRTDPAYREYTQLHLTHHTTESAG